jgi:hypothetical protein
LFLVWLREDGDGRLTGRDALKFFAMSNLSRDDLKQVNPGNLVMHNCSRRSNHPRCCIM